MNQSYNFSFAPFAQPHRLFSFTSQRLRSFSASPYSAILKPTAVETALTIGTKKTQPSFRPLSAAADDAGGVISADGEKLKKLLQHVPIEPAAAIELVQRSCSRSAFTLPVAQQLRAIEAEQIASFSATKVHRTRFISPMGALPMMVADTWTPLAVAAADQAGDASDTIGMLTTVLAADGHRLSVAPTFAELARTLAPLCVKTNAHVFDTNSFLLALPTLVKYSFDAIPNDCGAKERSDPGPSVQAEAVGMENFFKILAQVGAEIAVVLVRGVTMGAQIKAEVRQRKLLVADATEAVFQQLVADLQPRELLQHVGASAFLGHGDSSVWLIRSCSDGPLAWLVFGPQGTGVHYGGGELAREALDCAEFVGRTLALLLAAPYWDARIDCRFFNGCKSMKNAALADLTAQLEADASTCFPVDEFEEI